MQTTPSPVFDKYLTRSEERLLLATVSRAAGVLAKRDHAWMRLMRNSGGRVSSIAALNVEDARTALAGTRLYFHRVKGDRPYDVHVSMATRAALRDLLRIRRQMGVVEDPAGALILTRRGDRMSIRNFQNRLHYWRKTAGLAIAVTPHWFRHTLAQRVMETTEAVDKLGVVQRVLGHTTRRSTEFYTRPTREQVDQAMELQR